MEVKGESCDCRGKSVRSEPPWGPDVEEAWGGGGGASADGAAREWQAGGSMVNEQE